MRSNARPIFTQSGTEVVQETLGWDDVKEVTISQRSKEEAHDYRYFPEPDLPPLEISRAWVEQIKTELPELPEARSQRFVTRIWLVRSRKPGCSLPINPWRIISKRPFPVEKSGQRPSTIGSAGNSCAMSMTWDSILSICRSHPKHLAELVDLVTGEGHQRQ